MVEPAGIEPASAIFNCRDSFTSLAGFWLQQAHLKHMPAFKRSERTLSHATFCLSVVATSHIYWFLSSDCENIKIVVCDYYFVPFYLARHLQDLHHLNIRPRRNLVGPIIAPCQVHQVLYLLSLKWVNPGKIYMLKQKLL